MADEGNIVGSAFVELRPSLANFAAQAVAGLADALAPVAATVNTELESAIGSSAAVGAALEGAAATGSTAFAEMGASIVASAEETIPALREAGLTATQAAAQSGAAWKAAAAQETLAARSASAEQIAAAKATLAEQTAAAQQSVIAARTAATEQTLAARTAAAEQAAAIRVSTAEQLAAMRAAAKVEDETAAKAGGLGGILSGAFGRGSTAAKSFGSDAGSVVPVLGSVTSGVLAVGAATAVVAGVTAKMASTFQASMEQLHTQAGVDQRDIAGLSAGVLKLAGQVGQSPDSLAQALYHVESTFEKTGLTGKQAMDILRTAAEGARIGGSDLVDTQNALDAAVVSGIKGVQNYGQAMGLLNATVGIGDMKMQDLNEALSTGVLVQVKQYGVTMRDTAAALATFGDNNIRGANAGTALRMSVQAMTKAVAGGDEKLAKIGISTKQLTADMQQGGLNQALNDLVDHMNTAGLTGDKVGGFLTNVFGKRVGTGIGVLVGQVGLFNDAFAKAGAASMSFGEDWARTQDTTKQKVAEAKSALDAFGIELGDVFLPIVNLAISGVTLLAKGLSIAFAPVARGILVAFQAMGAGAKALKSDIDSAASSFVSSISRMSFVKTIIDDVRMAWGSLLFGFESPGVKIAPGISEIVAIFAPLGQALRTIFDDASEAWRSFITGFENPTARLSPGAGQIVRIFTSMGSGLATVLRDASVAWHSFIFAFENPTTKIAPGISSVVAISESLGEAFRRVGDAAKETFDWFGRNVLPTLVSVGEVVAKLAGGALIGSLIVAFDALSGILSTIGTVIHFLTDQFEAHRTTVAVLAGIVTAIFLPALVNMAAQMVITGAQALVTFGVDLVTSVADAAVGLAQLVIVNAASTAAMIAAWATMAAQAAINSVKLGIAWAKAGATAVVSAASSVVAAARVVASWVLMAVQSTLQALRVAGAWALTAGGAAASAIAGTAVAVAKVIASWAAMAAGAAWNAIVVANSWAVTASDAILYAAVHPIQAAKVVASWVAMAAGSALNATKVAASWVVTTAGSAAAAVASTARTVAAMLVQWTLLGVQSALKAAATAASWVVTTGTQAASAIASTAATVATIVASWVAMAAGAAFNALKTAVSWLVTVGPEMVLAVAGTVGSAAVIVASWVAMAAAATAEAIAAAAAWLITIAPLALVVAAVAGAAYLIIKYWGDIKQWAQDAWSGVVVAMQAAWQFMISTLPGYIGDVVGFVAGLPGKILGALGDFKNLLYGVGGDIIDGLKRGIHDAWHLVTEMISNLTNSLPGPVKKFLGISSPSKVFMEIGANVSQGMAMGIKSGIPAVAKAITQLQNAATGDALGASGFGTYRTGSTVGRSGVVNNFNLTMQGNFQSNATVQQQFARMQRLSPIKAA